MISVRIGVQAHSGTRFVFSFQRFPKTDKTELSIGTYGSIKNASMFILGTITQSERCFESYGYLFEQVVLKATDLGLSTCWLGYFTLPDLIYSQNLRDKEIIPSFKSHWIRIQRSCNERFFCTQIISKNKT